MLAPRHIANELTNWNSIGLSYDADGNMLTDGSNVFTWNARNQVGTLNNVGLQYDAFGRRTQNAAGTSFLYDGANVVQELSGTTVTANLMSDGIDEVFTRTDSAGAFTQLKDALGSTIALVDSNGNLGTLYTYDPFGNTSVSGVANANVYQYTGRENEGNGLYYYRARYYSPVLHRFISEDPLGFAGSGTNFYAYVGNSPPNFTDPTGLSFDSLPCLIQGGVCGAPTQKSSRGDTFDWWGEFWYQVFLAPGPQYHECPGTGGDLICNSQGQVVFAQGANDSSAIIFAATGAIMGAVGGTVAGATQGTVEGVATEPATGIPFPSGAQPGDLIEGVDPNSLLAGRPDLWSDSIAAQQNLIQQGIPRFTPIQVTTDGVIWDGNHAVAAAAQSGVPVTVQVVPGSITSYGPVTGLPVH